MVRPGDREARTLDGGPARRSERSLDDLDVRIKDAKKAARFAPSLPEKLRLQREVKTLESRRDEAWRAFDQASRELERDKEKLLDDIERRLAADIRREPLFSLRWRLV
jgi:hypothetical protein